MKSLYWFIDQVPLHVARKQAGVSEKQWRDLSYNLLKLMRDDIERQGAGAKLGGRGKVVCVDETFFTKKRRTRGGFQGNPSAGTQTIILGMVELDLVTRTETGGVKLIVIPDRKKVTLKRFIEENIEPGSLVFTDKFGSYSFMSRRGSAYVHRAVNHKAREFSRVEMIFGEAINVSTNSAEGLFGRVKAFCRLRKLRRVGQGCYGLVLAEYLWRRRELHQYSEWKEAGF